MGRSEYDFWQQHIIKGWRDRWTPPACDVPPGDRRLDTTEVGSHPVTDIAWPDDDRRFEGWMAAPHARRRLGVPTSPVPWSGGAYLQGRPIQRASARTQTIAERNVYTGGSLRSVEIPVPAAGFVWLEGNPTRGGGHDRHHIMVICDPVELDGVLFEPGSTVEMIGRRGNGCLAVARYDAEGTKHPDDPYVTKGAHEITSQLLNRFDPAHRLSITLNNYAAARWNSESEGNGDWEFPRVNDWVRLDPKRAPVGLDIEQQRLVDMLVTHGALINDVGGQNTLGIVSGSQWNGTTLDALELRLGMFDRVEYRPTDYIGPPYPIDDPLDWYGDPDLWAD